MPDNPEDAQAGANPPAEGAGNSDAQAPEFLVEIPGVGTYKSPEAMVEAMQKSAQEAQRLNRELQAERAKNAPAPQAPQEKPAWMEKIEADGGVVTLETAVPLFTSLIQSALQPINDAQRTRRSLGGDVASVDTFLAQNPEVEVEYNRLMGAGMGETAEKYVNAEMRASSRQRDDSAVANGKAAMGVIHTQSANSPAPERQSNRPRGPSKTEINEALAEGRATGNWDAYMRLALPDNVAQDIFQRANAQVAS